MKSVESEDQNIRRADKIVIGLVGEKGSGKETFGNLLQELLPEKKIVRIRSSDILVETLGLWDITKTRENLQDLAIYMTNGFGEEALSRAVLHRINSTRADIVIFDGVRWPTDVKLIRSFNPNVLVYVTADLQIRFNRLRARNEKAYEESTSFEQFMHEEKKKTEIQIPKIAKMADFKIKNNGTIRELKEQVRKFIFLLPE